MTHFYNVGRLATATAMLVALTGCGDIGYQINPGGDSIGPPPSVPEPANPPEPSPPPPSVPPSPSVPPLSTTIIDLSDGHEVGTRRWGDPQTDGSPIGGRFNCVFNPPRAYSFRAHLSILVNNELQVIPWYLGASRQPPTHCFYVTHTHDSTGRIHVTPAAPATVTLGDLFEIWGQPLTNTNVAGITGLPVEVFVTDEGVTVKVEDYDWANIELRPHREITIALGTPLIEIPNFTWTD